MNHQMRRRSCDRSNDVTSTAMRTYAATIPQAIASVSQADSPGMKRSRGSRSTYESAKSVPTWAIRKTALIPPRKRCRSSSHGPVRDRTNLRESASPTTTAAVAVSHVIRPAARVAYHHICSVTASPVGRNPTIGRDSPESRTHRSVRRRTSAATPNDAGNSSASGSATGAAVARISARAAHPPTTLTPVTRPALGRPGPDR